MATALRSCASVRQAVSRKGALCTGRPVQRRWAQVHDVRFLATASSTEKYFEKYRSKLEQRAKEIGVKNVDDLKKALLENERARAAKESVSTQQQQEQSSVFPPPPPPPPSPQVASSVQDSSTAALARSTSQPAIKTLSSFIDVPKFLDLPENEITTLWRLRHASSPLSLCATIPTPVYHKIATTARRHPQFILPLARKGQGAEVHFLQWTFPTPDTATVLFTHLAEYKVRGEYAQPHTTVTHHLEMADAKGLVLLQGQVMEGRGVSVEDGRWLLMCLQKFYGMEEKEERGRLLRMFTEGAQDFKVEELVSEAEKIV